MDKTEFGHMVDRVLAITGEKLKFEFPFEGRDYVLCLSLYSDHLPEEVIISEKTGRDLKKICSQHLQDELSLNPEYLHDWLNRADAFLFDKWVSKSETKPYI